MKDRAREIALATDVAIRVVRSSAHPVEYAIVLVVLRDGEWKAVRTFDNAHEPEEHHEHAYVGDDKQAPVVTSGSVNDAMHAALLKLRANWADMVAEWERTR